jgi:hypothetical protein
MMRAATFPLDSVAAHVHSEVTAAAEHQRIPVGATDVPAYTARGILCGTVVASLALPCNSSPERNSAETHLNLFVVQRRRRVFAQCLLLEGIHPSLKYFLSDGWKLAFRASLQ